MTPFELITEHGRPIAAIIPGPMSPIQIRAIYQLLPPRSFLHSQLSARWGLYAVAAEDAWAAAQLRRIPMLKPKSTIKLAFL